MQDESGGRGLLTHVPLVLSLSMVLLGVPASFHFEFLLVPGTIIAR